VRPKTRRRKKDWLERIAEINCQVVSKRSTRKGGLGNPSNTLENRVWETLGGSPPAKNNQNKMQETPTKEKRRRFKKKNGGDPVMSTHENNYGGAK